MMARVARPFSIPAALHRSVVDAAARMRDVGLRRLVLAGEAERMAAAVSRTWQAGTWADHLGTEKCLGCGGRVSQRGNDPACTCDREAVAA